MRGKLLTLALLLLAPLTTLAQTAPCSVPTSTNCAQPVWLGAGPNGNGLGTAANPLNVTGSSGGSGASTAALQSSTQSAPGSSSTAATGVQGVTGGLPVGTTDTNGAAIKVSTATDAYNNAPFTSATPMTAGTTYTAGRSVLYTCTVAGTVTETLAGGTAGSSTTLSRTLAVGQQQLPDSITAWAAGTATCGTVVNLY